MTRMNSKLKNEIDLNVTIIFSEEIKSDKEIAEVVENVLNGLRRQAQDTAEGLAGDEMDGFTDGIEVSAEYKFKPGMFCQTWDVHEDRYFRSVHSNKRTTL
jgi:hypothetical protein